MGENFVSEKLQPFIDRGWSFTIQAVNANHTLWKVEASIKVLDAGYLVVKPFDREFAGSYNSSVALIVEMVTAIETNKFLGEASVKPAKLELSVDDLL